MKNTYKETLFNGLKHFGFYYKGQKPYGKLCYRNPTTHDVDIQFLGKQANSFVAPLKDYFNDLPFSKLHALLFINAFHSLRKLDNEMLFLKTTYANNKKYEELENFFNHHITDEVIQKMFTFLLYSPFLLEDRTYLTLNGLSLSKEGQALYDIVENFYQYLATSIQNNIEESAHVSLVIQQYLDHEEPYTDNIIRLPFILNRFGCTTVFTSIQRVHSTYISSREDLMSAEILKNTSTAIKLDNAVFIYEYQAMNKPLDSDNVIHSEPDLYKPFKIGFSQILLLREIEVEINKRLNSIRKIRKSPNKEVSEAVYYQDYGNIISSDKLYHLNVLKDLKSASLSYEFLFNLMYFAILASHTIDLSVEAWKQIGIENSSDMVEILYAQITDFYMHELYYLIRPLTNFTEYQNGQIDSLRFDNKAIKSNLSTSQNNLVELRTQFDKLKVQYDKAVTELRKLENNEQVEALTNTINELKQSFELERKSLESKMNELKNKHLKEKLAIEVTVRKAEEQNADLRKNIHSLQQKIQKLEEEQKAVVTTKSPNELSFKEWLDLASFHLQGVDNSDKKRQLAQVFKQYVDIEELRKTTLREKVQFKKRVGYVKFEDDGYYVYFADNDFIKLNNLPKETFFTENQFVKVTDKGEMIYNFPFVYSPNENDYKNLEFAVVISFDEAKQVVKATTVNDEVIEIATAKKSYLNTGRVISYYKKDGGYAVGIVYNKFPLSLDTFYFDIISRGYQVLIYKAFTPTGLLVSEVATDENMFLPFENATEVVNKFGLDIGHVIIFDKDRNEVVRSFKSPMYRLSSFYDQTETVTVSLIQEDTNRVFVDRKNGERIILKDIPPFYHPTVDDVVIVDEIGTFIQPLKTYLERKRTVAEKIKRYQLKQHKEVTDAKEDLVPIKKKVMILGNPIKEFSYQIQLRKLGYDVLFMDGFEAKQKIYSKLRDVDAIVICPNFVSHDNMWTFRDDKSLTIPRLFPKADGVNVIANELSTI